MRQGRKSKEERGNYRIKQLKKEKEKKMTNVNESGRSMVEMLGVLAIIGVLSIGGIAGYTMAMNRYRANEVIDAASKMAVINMTKQTGAATTIAEIGLDNPVAGSGCNLSMTAIGTAEVALAGCDSDVLTSIQSIAGSKFSSNTNTLDFD